MNITVTVKQNYGVTVIYPMCEASQAFARIANTTTLTASTIKEIKALGYSITVNQPTIKL